MKRVFRRKLLSTFIFSLIASILLIIHGVFFDLDLSQIKRLTIEGFAFTFVLTFIGLVILEKVFSLEEHEEIIKIKNRLGKLERKRKH
ncbi:MAG: hypothetical protein AABX50_02365 [Nanoarchaeota archaeon]